MLFKPFFAVGRSFSKSTLLLLLIVLSIACNQEAKADINKVPKITAFLPVVTYNQRSIRVSAINSDSAEVAPNHNDPLDSPHAIPWNWVVETHEEVAKQGSSKLRYYRSPSLTSPDGQYVAYSRIQMQAEPEMFKSRITSVMFLENLQTGDLQTIESTPALPEHLPKEEKAQSHGEMAILIPVSWSKNGDRLLCRRFEGLFNTSDASDFAVIWDRHHNSAVTVSPTQVPYTHAVLLGWSKVDPEQVLFRAGILGEEHWSVWSVNLNGDTILAREDEPVIYSHDSEEAK